MRAPFRSLLFTQAFSAAGAQIAQLLISYEAVVQLRLSPLEMGVLTAAGRAPFLLFGLLAGWAADRYSKRAIMMAADSARALQIAAVMAILWSSWASLWTLMPLNFLIFTATVLFDISYSAYLPELVDRKTIADKNSRLEAMRGIFTTGAAVFAGYSLGKLAIEWTVTGCALMFVCSVVFLKGLTPPVAVARPQREHRWQALTSGFRSIAEDFNFSVLCLFGTVWNLVAAVEHALLFIHLNDNLHLAASEIGVVFMALNVAAIPGAYAAAAFKRWLPLRFMMIGTMILTALGWMVVSSSGIGNGVTTATVGIAMTGFFAAVYNVVAISYRQSVTPPEFQGRVIAAIRLVMWGVMPVGALIGGVTAESVGVRQTMMLAAGTLVLACGMLVLLRQQPAADALAE